VNHLNKPSPIKLQEHHYDDAPQSPACICMFVIMGAKALAYLCHTDLAHLNLNNSNT